MAFAQGSGDRSVGGDHQAFEFVGRQAARPAVEQLHRFGPGGDLAGEIGDRLGHDPVKDGIQLARIGIGHRPRGMLVAAPLARDHVGRHRPRAPGKAQHGHTVGQPLAAQTHGLVDRIVAGGIRRQVGENRIDQRRRKLGPFAGHEFEMLTKRMRYDQDIGKQDCPVEAEPVDRLQGNLARRFAVVSHREKPALFGPQRAIFGKIAPCLAHEPQGGPIGGLAVQRIEQETGHR